MAETILDGSGEQPPGHRILDGSDLEIAYNLRGNDLVLRVNKAGVQIFRVLLEGACRSIEPNRLLNFNSVSPDFVFKIGDARESLLAMGRSAGLTPEQTQKLDAKARAVAK